nr:TOBE domain-containing protein [Pseudomonadales bacterium]
INEIHDDRDGPTVVVLVSCGEQQLLARITRKSLSDLSLNVGQRAYAQVKGVALMVNNDR